MNELYILNMKNNLLLNTNPKLEQNFEEPISEFFPLHCACINPFSEKLTKNSQWLLADF